MASAASAISLAKRLETAQRTTQQGRKPQDAHPENILTKAAGDVLSHERRK
jgi:hypothetical protein